MKTLRALALAAGIALLPIGQAMAYTVDLYAASPMTNLSQADAAIAGTLTLSAQASIIEFDDLGDGTRGLFSINNPFPGGLNTSFAAHVYGNFLIDTAGTWTFGINHDDGARLIIDGSLVVVADGAADNRTTTITGAFAAGIHTMEIVYFENGGGASLEFFGRQGAGANALIQSVPEPGTLALLGLSLAGLGFTRRKSA